MSAGGVFVRADCSVDCEKGSCWPFTEIITMNKERAAEFKMSSTRYAVETFTALNMFT